MLKIITFLFLISLFYYPNSVNAQQNLPFCTSPNVLTSPLPLLSDNKVANFTIDVGNHASSPGNWKMEWQCSFAGTPSHPEKDALISGTNISATIDHSAPLTGPWFINACEFDPKNNPMTIKVKKNNTPICKATYDVIDRLCQLTIKPKNKDENNKGITTDTEIFVDIKELTPGGRYLVFIDNDAPDIVRPSDVLNQGKGNLLTPQDLNWRLPQEFVTPGKHTISIRPRRDGNDLTAIIQGLTLGFQAHLNTAGGDAQFFKSPICMQEFTVGDPLNPGSVKQPGQGNNPLSIPSICTTDPSKCSSAKGIACDPKGGYIYEKNDPRGNNSGGVYTAIGCIPTEPKLFVQSLFKVGMAAGGGIALLLMVFGAFQMITSAGNPETIKKGQEQFTSAIIGLLFIIFSILLLKIIGVDILGIPEFKI